MSVYGGRPIELCSEMFHSSAKTPVPADIRAAIWLEECFTGSVSTTPCATDQSKQSKQCSQLLPFAQLFHPTTLLHPLSNVWIADISVILHSANLCQKAIGVCFHQLECTCKDPVFLSILYVDQTTDIRSSRANCFFNPTPLNINIIMWPFLFAWLDCLDAYFEPSHCWANQSPGIHLVNNIVQKIVIWSDTKVVRDQNAHMDPHIISTFVRNHATGNWKQCDQSDFIA